MVDPTVSPPRPWETAVNAGKAGERPAATAQDGADNSIVSAVARHLDKVEGAVQSRCRTPEIVVQSPATKIRNRALDHVTVICQREAAVTGRSVSRLTKRATATAPRA